MFFEVVKLTIDNIVPKVYNYSTDKEIGETVMDILDRFLDYVSYPTMSNEESETIPSTAKQLILARRIAEDLSDIGAENVHVDEYGYVYATVPANCDDIKSVVGFVAHMDTASEASDTDIKAKVVEYNGGNIVLNESENIVLSNETYPSLNRYVGQHLVVTDGTTLLGADDKAGVAEIVTAAQQVLMSNKKHGTVKICITPDEEIGRGADKFDIAKFAADYAYTVDGGALGELEYENFNAASAVVEFYGVSIHPGSAKGIMKNAALMACEFNEMLPKDEIPSKTEGYEGFHHLLSIEGETEYAKLVYIIRDHDRTKFEAKKQDFVNAANAMDSKYSQNCVKLTLKDSYYNMKEKIEEHIEIVDYIKTAMLENGVEPIVIPIRGGTDGARLSYEGLPCPNICTGGENFHSRFEYVPVESMNKVTDIIKSIIYNTK